MDKARRCPGGFTSVTRIRLLALLGAVLLAAMALAACGPLQFDESGPDSMPMAAADFVQVESEFAATKLEAGDVAPGALGRQIIREGRINIEVEDVAGAFARVGDIARASGGFVAESSVYASPRDGAGRIARPEGAYLRLRIPADRFESARARVAELAKTVLSEDTSSQDVTMQVADFEARLRNLRATEQQYLRLLVQAQKVEEVLLVTDRLSNTRGEIERIEAQLAALSSLVDLATLNVDIQRAVGLDEDDVRGPLDAAREGWEASWQFLEAILEWSLAVIAFSWWLLPPIALALLVAYLRRRRMAAVDPGDAPGEIP